MLRNRLFMYLYESAICNTKIDFGDLAAERRHFDFIIVFSVKNYVDLTINV